jgi:hypothetical protein
MKPSPTPRKRFLAKDGPTPAELKWRPLVEEWRRGTKKAALFCRERDLSLSAFKYWKKHLALRDRRRQAERAASEARQAMRLVPVRIVESTAAGGAPGPVEVVLLGGRVLRVVGDFDPAVLRKLVAALEETR